MTRDLQIFGIGVMLRTNHNFCEVICVEKKFGTNQPRVVLFGINEGVHCLQLGGCGGPRCGRVRDTFLWQSGPPERGFGGKYGGSLEIGLLAGS